MSGVQTAEAEASTLESFQARIKGFSESEAQAESLEPLLRADRRAIALELSGLNADQVRARLEGGLGERVRLLIACGLSDLPRDSEDEMLAEGLRPIVSAWTLPAPGPLTAAMLLYHAYELPLPSDFDQLPDWLLPHYAHFLLKIPKIFNRLGDSERYVRFFSKAVALFHGYILRRPPPPLAALLSSIFYEEGACWQVYFNENNLKDLYRKRAQILESLALANGAQLAHVFPLRTNATPRRRLRVGILAGEFTYTETYFMLAQLEHFPRERCALTLYEFRNECPPLAEYLRSRVDATVMLPVAEVGNAAARIRADDLDVLLVASNITVRCSDLTALACFRLARVQAISGSSPVTTGLTSADWYMNAEENETEEGANTQYTEQVYRMPGMLTRYAYHLDSDPRTLTIGRAELGVPEDAVLFFSGANFFKLLPELSALWARILAQVPEAWLVLMPFNPNWATKYLSRPLCSRILSQVEEAGGDMSHVAILDPVPTRADLHAVMALTDVYLDSHPFPGACSLVDPLLVGLPVVARTGRTFRSGVGAAMLRGIGLGDLAVSDDESYVARAVELARNPALRERTRARIRAALSPHNPIFDSETGSRNLESALVDIAGRAEAQDQALLQQPPDQLRSAIERIAGDLASSGNRWFESLTDLELVRLVLVPYFRAAFGAGDAPHLLDVGACVGQVAQPFLTMGWTADLFEPDPACQSQLSTLAEQHGARVRLHREAVSDLVESEVSFYRSAIGLSGLSPSPHAVTEEALTVPSIRLDRFAREQHLARADFLKIDTEGWDFRALRAHDFAALPPRVAMVEYATTFPQQNMESIMAGVAEMEAHDYDALVFSYEDDGNFERQIWKYRLIAARFGAPVARKDGHRAGIVLFYRRGDRLFLASVLRLFLSFLPGSERKKFLPA